MGGCTNICDHVTKKAAIFIYGKTLKNVVFPEPRTPKNETWFERLGSRCVLIVYTNDPRVTFHYCRKALYGKPTFPQKMLFSLKTPIS